jgi:hypothetical protein
MYTTEETPNGTESSTVQTAETPAASATAVVKETAPTPVGEREAFHKKLAEIAPLPKEQEETPPVTETDAGEATEQDAAKDEQATKTEADPKTADLSQVDSRFDKRPEWQSLKKQTGEKFSVVKPVLRKLFERETQLTEQNRVLQVSDGVVKRVRAATGDEQGFNNALNLIEQYAGDPAAAVPMLENLLRDARSRAGLEITSKDLKESLEELDRQKSEDGMTDKEYDRQKKILQEVQKARAAEAQAKNKVKATEQAGQQARTQALIVQRQTAINDWEVRAMKDPDYLKRAKFVQDRAQSEVDERQGPGKPLMTGEEMVEMLERIDAEVKKELLAVLPKPKASRAVVGQRSSITSQAVETDPRAAFLQKLEQRAGKPV